MASSFLACVVFLISGIRGLRQLNNGTWDWTHLNHITRIWWFMVHESWIPDWFVEDVRLYNFVPTRDHIRIWTFCQWSIDRFKCKISTFTKSFHFLTDHIEITYVMRILIRGTLILILWIVVLSGLFDFIGSSCSFVFRVFVIQLCIPSSDNYKECKGFQAMLFLSLLNCLQGPYWKLKLIPCQGCPDFPIKTYKCH